MLLIQHQAKTVMTGSQIMKSVRKLESCPYLMPVQIQQVGTNAFFFFFCQKKSLLFNKS